MSKRASMLLSGLSRSVALDSNASGAEKRDVLNAKVDQLFTNSKSSVNELANELAEVDNEMKEVEVAVGLVEKRRQEAAERRALLAAATPVSTSGVGGSVSATLGAIGKSFSFRRTQQPALDSAAQRNVALASAEAEREEQQFVNQLVALTNHKNTLLHRRHGINLQ